jgi:transcriptional regulator GlxA family with amidase domain
MKAAFVLFDQLTALDFVGVYDPLTRLRSMNLMPDFEWRLCGWTEPVIDDRRLRLAPDLVREPLNNYDLVIVPGGIGTRTLMYDRAFLDWLRTAARVPLKASVCTGSLLLGAAGFLAGRRATTHPSAVEELAPLCAAVATERIVDEGDVITAGGVTAAIDLGLYLVERLAGRDTRARVAQQMDYPYRFVGRLSQDEI